MEVVAPLSFDDDIQDKIRTNEYNKVGRSERYFIKEEEKALTGQEDKEINKNSSSSKDKLESGVCVPSHLPKKPEGKEVDEVGTTTKMSQASTITFENTTQTVTNLSKNEKVTNIGSMVKDHEITGVWLLGDGKHQLITSARKEDAAYSDKKGPLPCNGYLGDTEVRTDHEDKRKNQITTIYS